MVTWLRVLDVALEGLHIGLLVINCTFWLIPRWRCLHRLVFGSTVFSWLGLGYFFGWGYCFLTDIHWSVKRSLDAGPLPPSFITYFANHYFDWYPSRQMIYNLSAAVFISLCLIVILQLIWEWRRRRSSWSSASQD
jgi:hypothetical protein